MSNLNFCCELLEGIMYEEWIIVDCVCTVVDPDPHGSTLILDPDPGGQKNDSQKQKKAVLGSRKYFFHIRNEWDLAEWLERLTANSILRQSGIWGAADIKPLIKYR
jgi:hypothetical protein